MKTRTFVILFVSLLIARTSFARPGSPVLQRKATPGFRGIDHDEGSVE